MMVQIFICQNGIISLQILCQNHLRSSAGDRVSGRVNAFAKKGEPEIPALKERAPPRLKARRRSRFFLPNRLFFCQTGFFSAKQAFFCQTGFMPFLPVLFFPADKFFALLPAPIRFFQPDKVFLSVKQVWRLFCPRFFSPEKFLCGAVLFPVRFSVGQLSSVLHFFVKSLTKAEKYGFENKVEKIEGEPPDEGEGIWLSEALLPAGLEIGGEVRIEETGQVFRLAGTFSGEIRSALRLGFSPSFLLAEDRAFAEASVICPAEEVFPLWQSALGARVSGDDGLFDLCEGYALAGGWLEVLFWLIAAASLLVAVRMTAFFLRHFARQTFLLRVFGLSRGRLILLYAGVLLAYGALGFALGVGLFYAFVGITEALSSGIMGMVFGEVSPLPMFALGGAVFALAAAGTAAAVLSGREGGQP